MKKVLIGSRAIKHHFPEFRDCKDTDFLIDRDMENHDNIEYYNCNKGVGLSLFYDSCDEIPSVNELYTLKFSHCFWDIHWEKTVHDIMFLQKNGAKIDEELFSMLYSDWTKIHGEKKSYLSVSNEEFFQDGVDRTIPHDTIHESVAYYDEPMFKKLKNNPDSAMLSFRLFSQLSHNDKIKTCREEIYTVAIERFLLINNRKSLLGSYRNSLKLLVISMTKGWFPRFIMENICELWNKDDVKFYEKFLNFCEKNCIKIER